jgi:hypothetical protein
MDVKHNVAPHEPNDALVLMARHSKASLEGRDSNRRRRQRPARERQYTDGRALRFRRIVAARP